MGPGPGVLAAVAGALVDLVAPATCAGCGARARHICAACGTVLTGPPCLRFLTAAGTGAPALPVVSVASYSGVARTVLLAYKERGRPGLAGPLAAAVVRAALACEQALPLPRSSPGRPSAGGPGAGLLVVPVPSSTQSVRRRGYDPVRRLAATTARLLTASGVPATHRPALRLAVRVSDQAGLPAAARQTNVAGAHALARRFAVALTGRPVLVVDDVVTTGATLYEATRALRAAGARPCGALTVAATRLRAGEASWRPALSALHVTDRCD